MLVASIYAPANADRVETPETNRDSQELMIDLLGLEVFLEGMAQEMTAISPVRLDSNIVMINAVAIGRELIVNYEYDYPSAKREIAYVYLMKGIDPVYLIRMLASEEFDRYMREFFWIFNTNGACSNIGLKYALEKGASLRYAYSQDNAKLFDTLVSYQDCTTTLPSLEDHTLNFFSEYMLRNPPES